MKIPVTHDKLIPGSVTLQSAGWWSAVQLWHDDQPAQKNGRKYFNNKYLVPGKNGPVEIKIQNRPFDPIPNLIIDNERIVLAPPLTWPEFIWMGLPALIAFAGGAIGAIVGIMAVYLNAHIFRGEQSTLIKYILTGFVSVIAVVMYIVLAILFVFIISG